MHKITGKSFSVSLFSASYDLMQDVQIATFFMEYTDKYGRTCILDFNEVLWFWNSIYHSLVNPNQIIMRGITVYY